MTKYNHALTVAYVVISDEPTMPTFEECIAAFKSRYEELINDEGEAREALMTELPFDTFTIEPRQ